MRFPKEWCVEEKGKVDGKGKLAAYAFFSERRKYVIIKDADIFKTHLCD